MKFDATASDWYDRTRSNAQVPNRCLDQLERFAFTNVKHRNFVTSRRSDLRIGMSTAVLENRTFPLARISVDQYHRMIEAGAFAGNDHVELIEGYLVEKMTKNPPHRVALGVLNDLLMARTPDGWHVANQDPITLDNSEPEPDLSVIRGAKQDYRQRHPAPSEVALVVEIADSSLAKDRGMITTYARNRIPAYWIVDINNESVEVYTNPQGSGNSATYADALLVHADESIPYVVRGQVCESIPVRDILS